VPGSGTGVPVTSNAPVAFVTPHEKEPPFALSHAVLLDNAGLIHQIANSGICGNEQNVTTTS
jgi:hypothetical protein